MVKFVYIRHCLKLNCETGFKLYNRTRFCQHFTAQDVKQKNLRGKDEASEEISGSFLTYTASFLLVFTILYNVIFATVIKPAVDGPETLRYTDIINEQKLSRSDELQLGP